MCCQLRPAARVITDQHITRLMAFSFSEADLERIAAVLGVSPKREGRLTRFEMSDPTSGRKIAVEILTGVDLPEELGKDQPRTLVSVYAASSFLQLHGCTGYIASQELGEIIFFAKQAGTTSGLVVEREAGSSLYANVDDRLLSTDFTQLPPEMIMSSVALSMTESLFNDLS
jgi:hypothetical protein